MTSVHPLISNPDFVTFKNKLERGETIRRKDKNESLKIDNSSTDQNLVLVSDSGEVIRRFHPAFFGMVEMFEKFK